MGNLVIMKGRVPLQCGHLLAHRSRDLLYLLGPTLIHSSFFLRRKVVGERMCKIWSTFHIEKDLAFEGD